MKVETTIKEVEITVKMNLIEASILHRLTQKIGGCPHESFRYHVDRMGEALEPVLKEIDGLATSQQVGSKLADTNSGLTFKR